VLGITSQLLPSFHFVLSKVGNHDSRDDLTMWIKSARPPHADVAVAGQLQLPISVFGLPGVDAFDPRRQSVVSLLQAGYSHVAVPSCLNELAPLTSKLQTFFTIEGDLTERRIPVNPAVTVVSASDDQLTTLLPSPLPLLTLQPSATPHKLGCESAGEDHCWISQRLSRIALNASTPPPQKLLLECMSPWPDQRIIISQGSESPWVLDLQPGVWTYFPTPSGSQAPLVSIKEIHSPASQGTSRDRRRLGVALRVARE